MESSSALCAFAVDPKSQAAQRPFAHKLVVRQTSFKT